MLPANPSSPNSRSLPWSSASYVAPEARHPLLLGLLGVMRYELGRSLSFSRFLGLSFMILFPVVLVLVAKMQVDQQFARIAERSRNVPDMQQVSWIFGAVIYALIPQVATMLSLLLWATPAVNSELEGQTWIYALIRPDGRTTLVLGKYLVAIFWSITGGCISTTLLIPLLGLENSWQLWWTIIRLLVLSSCAYGALFLLIGTFFQRRAMVAAFIYAVAVEGLLSFLPATINQLTISFRLRSLLVLWNEIELPSRMENAPQIFDLSASWHLVLGILIYTAICLTLSMLWLRRSEYSLQPEAAA